MLKLKELRRAKAALKSEFKSLRVKEDGLPTDEALPPADIDRMAAIEVSIAELDGRIARLEAEQAMDAEEAEEPEAPDDIDPEQTAGAAPGVGKRRVPAAAATPTPKGFKAARFVMGALLAKNMGWRAAANTIQTRFGDADVAKALNTTGVSTGGALIPQMMANEVIELLTAEVAVRRFNPTVIGMPGGNMTIPRLAGGATAGYQGELDDIPVSQPTFDNVQLNAKKLTALVPVTNDLLRRAPVGVERIITDNMVNAMALREDIAFLRGDGSSNSPVGLLNQCLPVNKIIGKALPTDAAQMIQAVQGLLMAMKLQMEMNLSRMQNVGWILPPTIPTFLASMINGFGSFPFAAEMAEGKLLGFPFVTSTQIPTNLAKVSAQTGTETNNTEIYLVDFSDVFIGDTMDMRVDTSNEATFKDAGGNVVSAFQRDETLFRVITENDLGVRHKGSIVVGIVPSWAPSGYAGFGSGFWYYNQSLATLGSAAPSTGAATSPTGSNNPGNSSVNAPGGTQPGLAS